MYVCEKCIFCLDFDCSKLSPSLKLDCHHHHLTFFKYFSWADVDPELQNSYCKACGNHCDGASVYRCVQCDISLHLKSVVPSSATHKYHRHSLTMIELIKEDDSEKYYCDVCENERNPKDPVYYCQSCTFIAHIQCDKVASGKVPSSSPTPMENEALFVEQNASLFRPIIHPHQMYKVTEELKGENYCSGCRLELNGSSYFCKTCPGFYLHEKCAKLSYEIRHPFHSSHPLNLYTSTGNLYTSTGWLHQLIACNECRDFCDGFIYFCEQCDFKLDMKCVALTTHKIGVLEEKITGRVTELHHFTHPHKLVLANCNDPKHERKCNICRLQILGPAYFCTQKICNYILHESCLRLPQKIQVAFHPNHMLVSRLLPTGQRCDACTMILHSGEFVYSCEHCDFNLHVICANSFRRPLKCEFHLNDLYYFGRNHFSFLWGINFNCELCDVSCKGESFYRCLKCGINFHLKCVRIPYAVKSKYHIHPLLLKDSFIEDEFGKYYCDFCEEERNPNDDIYYCEECNGQTIAHIECVLAEVEDNKEIRKNIHEERFRKELENLVARFMKFLSNECRPPIQEVIQAGVVPHFVELLGSPSDYVREQAVLALGNIAAVSLGCRDHVLGHGALLPLLALLNEDVSCSMLRNATWTLSRFCKPPFDQVKLVLPTLTRLIHSKDEAVLAKACRVLSYLSDGTNDKIQAVLEAGVLGRLVELLMCPSYSVITSALYTVKHIVARNDVQIQAIIEANIIAPLVHLHQNAEFDIRVQAARAISNATSGGTHDQIRFLVSQGCIKSLCDFLYYADEPETIAACLQGLENILKVGEADKNMGITGGVNLYAQMIDAAGGREAIESLLSTINTEIFEKTVKVLKLLKQSSILQG
ncbi:Armadillo [Gossypium australe]|uniref:Armadillo n=1 Tax=Gossypium australe TaxID=47621 RepID=A0A5B6VUF7_9ROSI|nr:Armadillo [Gossypium australe]